MKSNVSLARHSWSVPIMLGLLFAGLISLSLPADASAESADDLARTANKMIRNAERNMHNRKIDLAVTLLEEAQSTLDALKVADPSHRQLKSLENKYARIKKQVDKKLGGAQAKRSSPSASTALTEPGDSSGDKLPGGVSKRIRDIKREMDQVKRYLSKGTESSAKQAQYILGGVQSLFDDIDKKYGDQFDTSHPDYAAAKERFDRLEGDTNAALAAAAKSNTDAEADEAAKKKQSAEWIPKFQAYLSYPGNEGHDPNLLVYVPGTSEPEKFADAQKRYEAFKSFYESYQAAEFPHGKTWKLETLAEKDGPQRLVDFQKQFADRVGTVFGEAEKHISEAMAYLEKKNGWKNDPSVKPPLIDKNRMNAIDNLVKNVNSALGSGSPEAAKINRSYAALTAQDKEYRKIRAERTFLSPDIYSGGDKKDLLKKARAIIANEKPGSKVLRVTIYKDGWEEKTVEGWRDTSRTQWEKKTFREINANAGARDATGVYLYTIYLAQDKTSTGWSNLYGHIMYSDPMAEENVDK